MWQGIDSRRFPRAQYPCKVVIFKHGQKDSLDANTENIGAGGICAVLKKSLDKFSPVGVVLYLKDNQPAIECDGRVVWAVKRKDIFDTGIEFIDIRDKDILRIERVVEECLNQK